ncbi:MAG: hypothetical protein IJA51_00160 [Oscillospiraceae bacterium]|nr:hypothetical protein [Oscillospiraceae bacterium]
MKKKLPLILCITAVLLLAISQFRGAVIGTIHGAEMEEIEVDGVTYVQNNQTGFSSNDRGRFLGRATAGDTTFRLYTVKGDTEGRYLFRLWEWEGAFYERQN